MKLLLYTKPDWKTGKSYIKGGLWPAASVAGYPGLFFLAGTYEKISAEEDRPRHSWSVFLVDIVEIVSSGETATYDKTIQQDI